MARRRRVARMRSPQPSAGSAARYQRALTRHVVRPIRGIVRAELDDVLRSELAANAERMRRDQMSDRVRAALLSFADRLRRFVSDDEAVGKSVVSVGGEVDRRHKGEFYGSLEQAVGVNILATEPFRGAVMDQWVRSNTGLIRSLSQSTVRGISREVDEAFAAGLRHEELARRWRERGIPVEFGTLEGRTKVIARDQVNKLNGQLTQARQENLGVTHYVWRTSGDERVRDRHVELDGQRFAWDSPPSEGHPGSPVQCFPASAVVCSPSEAISLFRRRYSGPMVELHLHDGRLKATPNHPVLTTRGWLPLNEVEEGDHLVHVRRKVVGSSDDNWRESSFGELHDLAQGSRRRRLVGCEFHGDASIHDQVDVVDIEGLLGLNLEVASAERLAELVLTGSDGPTAGSGNLPKRRPGLGRAAGGCMGSSSVGLSLLRGQLPHPLEHGVSATAKRDAGILKPSSDHVATHSDALGHGFDRLACEVSLSKVVEVRRGLEFVGWVHNLNVRAGWYICNGFVVHNCRCVAEAVLDLDSIGQRAEAFALQRQAAQDFGRAAARRQ